LNEIEELKTSLHYAEYLLARTRQEKDRLELEYLHHEKRVSEPLRRELGEKEQEKRALEERVEGERGERAYAEMQLGKIRDLAKEKIF
jgi:hypothetical protein